MRNGFRIFIYAFVIITGAVAGTGLLIMDNVLSNLTNPVVVSKDSEEAAIPEDLNGIHMGIRVDKESEIRGYYMDVPGSEYVILFTHDCNGNVFHRFEMMRYFKELGVSVMAIDFRGFGASDPTEISDDTFHKDLSRIYASLRRKKWSSSRIIVYGQGIGAGIQGELIENNQCAAWIMDNPIPSLAESASGSIARLLTVDRLSVYPAIKKEKTLSVILYDEEIVPEQTVEKMKKASSKLEIYKLKGARTRGTFDSSDWDAWENAMNEILNKLKKHGTDDSGPPKSIPVKKMPEK